MHCMLRDDNVGISSIVKLLGTGIETGVLRQCAGLILNSPREGRKINFKFLNTCSELWLLVGSFVCKLFSGPIAKAVNCTTNTPFAPLLTV